MDVDLYDGRTGTWRRRDVPLPLREELTLSRWTTDPGASRKSRLQGHWTHDVYRHLGRGRYAFVGTAPTDQNVLDQDLCGPAFSTIPWRGRSCRLRRRRPLRRYSRG